MADSDRRSTLLDSYENAAVIISGIVADELGQALIKPQYRDLAGPGVPFGAEVCPGPGADDWERLAAFMGRDPRTTLGL